MKSLSICIPTYNRKTLLCELLDSIFFQIDDTISDMVQICISDNASTDGTSTKIADYQKYYGSKIDIVFNSNDSNIGADANYLKCISLATAHYCWIVGSDDVLEVGAIKSVLNAIERYAGVALIVGNRLACTYKMKPMFKEFWLTRFEDIIVDFAIEQKVASAWDTFDSTTALFGYLSVLIIQKSSWDSVLGYEKFIGSAYIHAYIILSFLLKGETAVYIKEIIMRSRFGNDSFHSSLGQRILLDVNGYLKLSEIVPNTFLRQKFLSVVMRHYNAVFLYAFVLSNSELFNENAEKFLLLGFPPKFIYKLANSSRSCSIMGLGGNLIKMMFCVPVRFFRLVKIAFQKLH